MDIQDLGSLGELIAAIATVATLAYLAYQIRLNTFHSRAYTQRDVLSEVARDHEKSIRISDTTQRGLSNFDALSDREKMEFGDVMLSMTTRFESSLRLYRSGLLDNVLFRAHRAWLLAWLLTPGGTQWWSGIRRYYSEDVREYLDDAIDNKIELPPPVTEMMPYYAAPSNRES